MAFMCAHRTSYLKITDHSRTGELSGSAALSLTWRAPRIGSVAHHRPPSFCQAVSAPLYWNNFSCRPPLDSTPFPFMLRFVE